MASRLDELEEVLRLELQVQRLRADQAEAQLGAIGDVADYAASLVTQAREDARLLSASAREQLEKAAGVLRDAEEIRAGARRDRDAIGHTRTGAPAPIDVDLLLMIRDHLVDMAAVQREMINATRETVVRMLQASAGANRTAIVRPFPASEDSHQDRGEDHYNAAGE